MELAILNDNNRKENFREIGRQFAYDGLDESYLKDATPEELREFREGFNEVTQKAKSIPARSDELEIENESRSMHR